MTKETFYSGFMDRTCLSEARDAEYGVYFILDGKGKIKIGKTKNIAKRMTDLQVVNPNVLRLAGWISMKDMGYSDADYSKVETNLHYDFDFCHIYGEWYEDLPVLEYLFFSKALLYPYYYLMNSGYDMAKTKIEKEDCIQIMRSMFWDDFSELFRKKEKDDA